MLGSPYAIRTMRRDEMQLAIAWAAAEGWNPGVYDAECFYTTDPHGFWLGLLDGEPIAILSAVKYGRGFAFLGFYIVRSEYRGQGFGRQLWHTALSSVQGRTIGLDGVLAQQGNYQKSGFRLAHRNIRYEGVAIGEGSIEPNIVELTNLPFSAIEDYDRPFFPDDRTSFLRCWLAQRESAALGILEDGELAGYGMLRVCQAGYRIGPLFADRPSLAESLFLALQGRVEVGSPIYLDTPEINPAAVSLAERYGMRAVFETARMYTHVCPDLPFARWFGVTTFELG